MRDPLARDEVLSYAVYAGLLSDAVTTLVGSVNASAELSFVISDLPFEGEYDYFVKVEAVSAAGVGLSSPAASVTAAPPPPVCVRSLPEGLETEVAPDDLETCQDPVRWSPLSAMDSWTSSFAWSEGGVPTAYRHALVEPATGLQSSLSTLSVGSDGGVASSLTLTSDSESGTGTLRTVVVPECSTLVLTSRHSCASRAPARPISVRAGERHAGSFLASWEPGSLLKGARPLASYTLDVVDGTVVASGLVASNVTTALVGASCERCAALRAAAVKSAPADVCVGSGSDEVGFNEHVSFGRCVEVVDGVRALTVDAGLDEPSLEECLELCAETRTCDHISYSA